MTISLSKEGKDLAKAVNHIRTEASYICELCELEHPVFVQIIAVAEQLVENGLTDQAIITIITDATHKVRQYLDGVKPS